MTDKSIRDGLILTIRYWRKEADSFRENAGLLDAKGKAHQADLQGRTADAIESMLEDFAQLLHDDEEIPF